MKNTVVIANDHAGTKLKFQLVPYLEDLGFKVKNLGTNSDVSVDYPDYVHPVAENLTSGDVEFGILICGSGQGVSMLANKYRDVRAAVCWEPGIASLARKHNNANVLCLPARFLSANNAKTIVKEFLHTAFEEGRHLTRIQKFYRFN